MEPNTLAKLFIVGLVILGTAFHEMAHAFVAYWCGDPTPGKHGRLTLNPLPHLSPPLTAIVFPIIFYMTGGGLFCLALTPIDPTRMRHPLRDQALVAVAGPLMNFLFAGIMIGMLWLIPGLWDWTWTSASSYPEPANWGTAVLPQAAMWNFILGCFNLLPLPPLDGYRIARPLMPIRLRRAADDLARSGLIALVLVLIIGGFLFNRYGEHLLRFYWQLLPEVPPPSLQMLLQ